MLNLRGFSAWIESNGCQVPEHLIAVDEEGSRVSCWIPGVEGQTFSVFWQDEGSQIPTCAFIFLDGVGVPGRFLSGQGKTSRSGVRASAWSERPFMFKKVNDSAASAPQGLIKDAGSIVLKIKRIKYVKPQDADPLQTFDDMGRASRTGDSITVGFGEEQGTSPRFSATWKLSAYESDDPEAQPRTYVSFVFRYRSPDFLEMQGIASPAKRSSTNQPPSARMTRVVSLPPTSTSSQGPRVDTTTTPASSSNAISPTWLRERGKPGAESIGIGSPSIAINPIRRPTWAPVEIPDTDGPLSHASNSLKPRVASLPAQPSFNQPPQRSFPFDNPLNLPAAPHIVPSMLPQSKPHHTSAIAAVRGMADSPDSMDVSPEDDNMSVQPTHRPEYTIIRIGTVTPSPPPKVQKHKTNSAHGQARKDEVTDPEDVFFMKPKPTTSYAPRPALSSVPETPATQEVKGTSEATSVAPAIPLGKKPFLYDEKNEIPQTKGPQRRAYSWNPTSSYETESGKHPYPQLRGPGMPGQ